MTGVLDIISGVFALFIGALVGGGLLALKAPPLPLQLSLFLITAFFGALGALGVVGGVYALRGKMGAVALAGSLAASVCLPPLGVAATVLVLLSARFSWLSRLLILVIFIPLWLALLMFLSLVLLGYLS